MKNIDAVKSGDWLFTCRLEPLQFSHFEPKNTEDYEEDFLLSMNEDQLSNFLNDHFVTTDGASHSYKNCTCRVISENYAKWFIANNVYNLFDQFEAEPDPFFLYEKAVKSLCPEFGIQFEGV